MNFVLSTEIQNQFSYYKISNLNIKFTQYSVHVYQMKKRTNYGCRFKTCHSKFCRQTLDYLFLIIIGD